MIDQPPLHFSILAMVSLASGIASNHPEMIQCQLDRLRQSGIPAHQIDAVIEIARHIRDEASEKLDYILNEKLQECNRTAETDVEEISIENGASCCASTVSGQSCC